MLLLIGVCSLTSNLGWLVIPPLLPTITDDLAITGAQAGIAMSVLAGLSALWRFPGGRLADQLSRKTVLAFTLIMWIVGFSVLSTAQTYAMFLFGAVLIGTGLGTYVPAAFAQISDLFIQKQGRAFGVNNAAFNLGGILASGLALAVLAFATWRAAFAPVLVIMVSLLILLHFVSRDEYVIKRVELGFFPTIKRLVIRPRIRTLLMIAALFSFVWNGAVAFFPTFLEIERGLSATMAGVAFASLFVTGVIVTPFSGALGDRFGNLHIVLASILFGLIGILIIVVAPSPFLVLLGVVTFSVGITGFWPVMTSYMMSAVPDGSKAGDYGAVGTVYMAVGSMGPTYVGVVGEQINFITAYAGLSICLGICLLLIGWLLFRFE